MATTATRHPPRNPGLRGRLRIKHHAALVHQYQSEGLTAEDARRKAYAVISGRAEIPSVHWLTGKPMENGR